MAGVVVAGIVAIAVGLGPQAVFLPLGGMVLLNLGMVAWRLFRAPHLIDLPGAGFGAGPPDGAERTQACNEGAASFGNVHQPIRKTRRGPSIPTTDSPRRDDLFLVLWLVLEVVGCFVLSPYSAVRRVLGIVVAASVLVVRLASRSDRPPLAPARWAAAFGVGLGLFYFAIDYEESVVDRRAAWDAAGRVNAAASPGEKRYFAGRWGFRYHAEQAGLTPVASGRDTFAPGDWLAVVENKVAEEPRVVIEPADANEVATLSYDAPRFFPPLRTVPTYYAGKNPLERQAGPRLVVHVYQVNRPFTPLGFIPPWVGPKDRAVGAVMQVGKARR
jgi:hypothetical protein